MFTYYWCIVFILLFALISDISKNKKFFLLMSYILLVFISSFRGNTVGGDLGNYLPLYREVSNMSFSDMLSPTKYGYPFIFLNKIISFISTNEQFFIIITSIINISFVFLFIRKYSKVFWLSVLLYITFAYYTNSFNSIRSSMALGCILFSYKFILARKYIKFLLMVVLATSIHLSAVVLVFLYPFSKIKPNLLFIVSSVLCCFFISEIMGPIILYVSSLYNPQYAMYESESSGKTLLMLLFAITLFAWFFNRKQKDNSILFFTSVMLYATCLQCFAPYFGLMTRCSLFFHISLIVLIPNVLYVTKLKRFRELTYLSVIILSLLYFKVTVMTLNDAGTNSQATLPYEFCWNNTQTI